MTNEHDQPTPKRRRSAAEMAAYHAARAMDCKRKLVLAERPELRQLATALHELNKLDFTDSKCEEIAHASSAVAECRSRLRAEYETILDRLAALR